MSDLSYLHPTRKYLLENRQLGSEDLRLEFYEAIQAASCAMDPWCFLTITTTTPIRDEVLFEGVCRRIAHQLHREVLGMRKKSRIPMLVVLERSANKSLHAHLIIGKAQGRTRNLKDTTFRCYIQKRPFSALLKILQRLSFSKIGNAVGKIGVIDITPVYCRHGLVDYLLKTTKEGLPEIAWLASNLCFSTSTTSKTTQITESPRRLEN